MDVTETHVTAELFDQAMARLARKRVPALESAPELVVEQVLERARWRACARPVTKEYALAPSFEAATAVLGRHQDNPVSLGMAVLAFETHLLD